MISFLHGRVEHAASDQIVLAVDGIGYLVSVTPAHARSVRVGEEIKVLTTLIVREDALTLYGFETPEQKGLFDVLRSVGGVGPKLALAVLGALTPDQIAQAVHDEDPKPFQSVSGIGAKTAKLIAVQLAGRIAQPVGGGAVAAASGHADALSVTAALVGLGWPEKQAQQAVADAAAAGVEGNDTLLKAALRMLGGAR